MFKKFLMVGFILIANIYFVYAKAEAITLACLPSEGTMEEKERVSYISAIEGAFIKAGNNVADRQRLEKLIKEMEIQDSSDTNEATAKAGKLMKVDYLVAVIIDNWHEKVLDTRAMEQDRKNDTMKPKENYYRTFEKVRITLKIIEVETSMIIAQGNVEDYRYYNYRRDTQGKLAKKVVNKVMKDVKKELKKKR